MTIELLNLILGYVFKFTILVLLIVLVVKVYKYITTKYIDIKNKQIENDKLKLYSSIDPKLVREELIQLIRDYTARYMTKSIMVNQIDFIKNDQVDNMVKDIVKDVVLEMSDLYLSYCKLLYTINNEDDLLKCIYLLTVDVVLDAVTKFNKAT